MSLADFWDNITTPGFFSTSFEELKKLCSEFKEEFREIVEEGEEIFTDGFKEMVINDNNEYKTSINKRIEGREEIEAIKKRLLESRGVTDEWLSVCEIMEHELKLIFEAIRKFEDFEIEYVTNKMEAQFNHVLFMKPDELIALHHQAANLLEVPEPPSYASPPSDEKVKYIGPIEIETSDKKKRIIAADKYLQDIQEYKKLIDSEVKKKIEAGLLFDTTAIPEDAKEMIISFEQRFWNINTMLCRPKINFPEQYAADEMIKKAKLCVLIILASGIYSVSTCLMKMVNDENKPFSEDLRKEMEQLNILTEWLIEDDESDIEKEETDSIGSISFPWENIPWLMALCQDEWQKGSGIHDSIV